jgi:hypothetical protein
MDRCPTSLRPKRNKRGRPCAARCAESMSCWTSSRKERVSRGGPGDRGGSRARRRRGAARRSGVAASSNLDPERERGLVGRRARGPGARPGAGAGRHRRPRPGRHGGAAYRSRRWRSRPGSERTAWCSPTTSLGRRREPQRERRPQRWSAQPWSSACSSWRRPAQHGALTTAAIGDRPQFESGEPQGPGFAPR